MDMKQRKLTPDDFTALRSLLKGDWRLNDCIFWKENGRWFPVYRESPPWLLPFRTRAFDAVERLIEYGLVVETVRTCCEHHQGQPLWKLTEQGRKLIERANSVKQLPKPKARPSQRSFLEKLAKAAYWRFRNWIASVLSPVRSNHKERNPS